MTTQNLEQWKPIAEFPHYEISTSGRVRNTRTNKLLKPSRNPSGYYKVYLYDDTGMRKQIYLSRLVLTTFERPARPGEEADHINPENLADCSLKNLRWLTKRENLKHRDANQLFKRFFTYETKPAPQETEAECHLSLCPYCFHDFEGMTCDHCSGRQERPFDAYRRNMGAFS